MEKLLKSDKILEALFAPRGLKPRGQNLCGETDIFFASLRQEGRLTARAGPGSATDNEGTLLRLGHGVSHRGPSQAHPESLQGCYGDAVDPLSHTISKPWVRTVTLQRCQGKYAYCNVPRGYHKIYVEICCSDFLCFFRCPSKPDRNSSGFNSKHISFFLLFTPK